MHPVWKEGERRKEKREGEDGRESKGRGDRGFRLSRSAGRTPSTCRPPRRRPARASSPPRPPRAAPPCGRSPAPPQHAPRRPGGARRGPARRRSHRSGQRRVREELQRLVDVGLHPLVPLVAVHVDHVGLDGLRAAVRCSCILGAGGRGRLCTCSLRNSIASTLSMRIGITPASPARRPGPRRGLSAACSSAPRPAWAGRTVVPIRPHVDQLSAGMED